MINVAVSIYENEICITVLDGNEILYKIGHVLIEPNNILMSDPIYLPCEDFLSVAVDNRRQFKEYKDDYKSFLPQDIEIDILGKKYKLTEVEPTNECED